MEKAMVSENCLVEDAGGSGKKLTGIKTEMRTSDVAITALVTSAMAMLVASWRISGDRLHAFA